jgi:hypothetical protein
MWTLTNYASSVNFIHFFKKCIKTNGWKEYNIKTRLINVKYESADYINLAQVKYKQRILVSNGNGSLVPEKADIFLANCVTEVLEDQFVILS